MFIDSFTTLSKSLLEETALNIFKELGVIINPSDIETGLGVGSLSYKKVNINMSGRKDASRVRCIKETLRV